MKAQLVGCVSWKTLIFPTNRKTDAPGGLQAAVTKYPQNQTLPTSANSTIFAEISSSPASTATVSFNPKTFSQLAKA